MLGRLLAIILLVLLNAFFVGAEFALVRSRRTRLEAMVRSGDRLARFAVRGSSNISRILSASQLGVTLASLGLGWVAESTVGEVFEHLFANLPFAVEVSMRLTLAATVALVLVTYLHVVFGELVPKAAALNHPEALARWLAPPLLLFAWFTTPVTYFINRSSQVILRMLGQEKAGSEEAVHSPEEIRLLVEQSQESGQMQAHDADLIDAVFEFSEKNAREVMTPRTELVALPVEATLSEVLGVVQESGLSRYPVYDESIDNIIGVVLAKDLLKLLAPRANTDAFDLPSIMRPVHVIPGSREVEEVLADFKRLKEHMAVVLDEYGGTAGVVTMEDLLEEIVGEILDEYDTPEDAEAPLHTRAGETLVPGSTHIGELNEHFSLTVPDEDYTTIGGYVFGVLGRLPVVGDRVIAGGAIFTVREMDGRRIETLSVDLHTMGDRRTGEREVQSTHTEG
ncbi:MAG: hemolysin family protein [Gemmatimonadota bacterium]|nr:hemolysin family protein [Gemmatimonadota bacterium]